jgi:hypothetical protein
VAGLRKVRRSGRCSQAFGFLAAYRRRRRFRLGTSPGGIALTHSNGAVCGIWALSPMDKIQAPSGSRQSALRSSGKYIGAPADESFKSDVMNLGKR